MNRERKEDEEDQQIAEEEVNESCLYCFEKTYPFLTKIKVYEMPVLMVNIAAKIAPTKAMPDASIFVFKGLLDVPGFVLHLMTVIQGMKSNQHYQWDRGRQSTKSYTKDEE